MRDYKHRTSIVEWYHRCDFFLGFRIKEVLDELKALESGIVGDSLLGVLREVRTLR